MIYIIKYINIKYVIKKLKSKISFTRYKIQRMNIIYKDKYILYNI